LSTQRSMRIHLSVAIALSVVSAPLRFEVLETALLLLLVGLVFSMELLNTALEACVDLCSPNHHPLAKRAKDVSATAVLVLAITAIVLFLVLFERQWPLLYNTWPTWTKPMALAACSWALATAEWAWFRHHWAALPSRIVAVLLWQGNLAYVHNVAFWGLGLCLLLLSGHQKKATFKA